MPKGRVWIGFNEQRTMSFSYYTKKKDGIIQAKIAAQWIARILCKNIVYCAKFIRNREKSTIKIKEFRIEGPRP